jgi:hypothetical protein
MPPIAPPRGAHEAPHALSAAAAPAGAPRSAADEAAGAGEGATAAAGTVQPNPALQMDPELGLVILEFRDRRGEVAATIPTSRELDAYRRAARTGAPRPAT